jgi:glycosyltransferase 2 family protein
MDPRLGRVRWKKWLIISGIAASVVFGYLAIRDLRWEDAYHALTAVQILPLIISFFFLAVSYCIMARRWQLIIGSNQASWCDVLFALIVGLMFNNVVPARLGEISRAVFLGIKVDLSKAYLVGTVLLDRLMDLVILVALALLLFSSVAILPVVFSFAVIASAGTILGCGVVMIFLFRGYGMKRLLNSISVRLPTHSQEWFTRIASLFLLSLAAERSWWEWYRLLGLSLGAWLLMGISLFFSLQAFNINISVFGVGVLLVVLNLGGMIPSSPGYIGTYHWLAVTTLAVFGINRGIALSFALVYHFLWYVPQILLGLAILFRENINLRKLAGWAKGDFE